MSEGSIKSVSTCNSETDTIFLQPIDQQYEKDNKLVEFVDVTDQFTFFEEYDQKNQMNDMFEYLNASTDSESLPNSRNFSVKSEDDNTDGKSPLRMRNVLKGIWEKSIEETVRSQKNQLNYFVNQKFGTSPMVPPFSYNTRSDSNSLPQCSFSLTDSCPFYYRHSSVNKKLTSQFSNPQSEKSLNASSVRLTQGFNTSLIN